VLGIELRASHLVGECFTTWAMPQASFAFSLFFR
jgi:hypothetical protein